MWSLCFALSELGGDAYTFCRLLKLFVTEFGQWVNAECGVALSRVEYVLDGHPPVVVVREAVELDAEHGR